ncbi:MAG: ferritin-like domain-containing protein [Gammaproteobacteria bacterium]
MIAVFKDALECLLISHPEKKCLAVFAMQVSFTEEELDITNTTEIDIIATPGRPNKPTLVSPREVPRRNLSSLEGRIALIHAIAHIEFNAINLALDAMYRFQDMPLVYYKDWMQVAFEEAQHFTMLRARLHELDCEYGDYDAHDGLWEMAIKTQQSVIARMALVPRVLEARGLDVTPSMIKRLQNHGDDKTVEILKIIFEQEIGHVAIGSRWFNYACQQNELEPEETFQNLLKEYMSGELRGPFELDARRKAGFSENELQLIQNI